MAPTVADGAHQQHRGAEHEGLAGTFQEKVIRLNTMQARLLFPTAAAIAVIVAAAALLATRDLDWPLVAAGTVEDSVLGTVPLPVAVLATVALILGWSFVLAGALHAHPVIRVGGVAAYALLGLVSAIEADSIVATPVITIVVLCVVVAAIGLYLTDRGNHRQAPLLHHRAQLRLPTFLWVVLATSLIYGLLALHGVQNGTLGAFIDLQLDALQFLFIPVLLLAGTDFAEWAEVVSGRLSSLLERLSRGAMVAAISVAAVLVLAWTYLLLDGNRGVNVLGTLRNLVPFLLVGLVVTGIGVLAVRRPTSTRVPFWALAAGAGILYLGLFGGAVAGALQPSGSSEPSLPALVAARSDAAPRYSLLVPHAWRERDLAQGREWTGSVDGEPARLVLVWGRGGPARALAGALAAPVTLREVTTDGAWTRAEASVHLGGDGAAGEIWTRSADGRTWTLLGLRAGGQTARSRALFAAAQQSWTLTPGQQEESGTDYGPVYYVIWDGSASLLMLSIGLALLLFGAGELASGGLFLALCGLFTATGPLVAEKLFDLLFGGSYFPVEDTLILLIGGAYAALIAMLVTTLVPRWRLPQPVLRLLFVLLLGFAGLQVLFDGVFGTALDAGERFSLVQGLVLVAAMLWDVLMSGETFTNTGGLAVPRHSRVLIYLGYTVMVVTCVIFLGSVGVQGGGAAGQEFESDLWPQMGIAALGPPLLLTFFFVNLRAWREARPMARADGLDQVDRSSLDEVGGEPA